MSRISELKQEIESNNREISEKIIEMFRISLHQHIFGCKVYKDRDKAKKNDQIRQLLFQYNMAVCEFIIAIFKKDLQEALNQKENIIKHLTDFTTETCIGGKVDNFEIINLNSEETRKGDHAILTICNLEKERLYSNYGYFDRFSTLQEISYFENPSIS